jgi:hypothetical protein
MLAMLVVVAAAAALVDQIAAQSGTGTGTACNDVDSDGALVVPTTEIAIGQQQFENCLALRIVTIPATVEVIGSEGFNHCENLVTVLFTEPSRLRTIEDGAFKHTGLTSITIPASVERLGVFVPGGDGVLEHCPNLVTVMFTEPSCLRTIEKESFSRTGLTSIIIPATVKNIGLAVFSHSPLTLVEYCGTATVENNGGRHTDLHHIDVTCNGVVAWEPNTGMGTSCGDVGSDGALAIPKGTTELLIFQLSECAALRTLTIPATVKTGAPQTVF